MIFTKPVRGRSSRLRFSCFRCNTLGSRGIKLPLPPGTLPTLYKNYKRFISEYLTNFPGFYETKDAGMIDDDGYICIMARTDNVICTAGYRLSTGASEYYVCAIE